MVAPDFESRLSHELGNRVLTGVGGLEMFVEALEQDFSEFHYDADEFVEVGNDGVLVLGRIFAKARATGMPLSGEFGHIWTVRDGLAARVAAHRDPTRHARRRGFLSRLVPEVAALGEDDVTPAASQASITSASRFEPPG